MARKAEKITRDARIACEKWRQYWQRNIETYNEFVEFVLGRQWTDDEEDMLFTNKKVPLQCNKLATLANSLLGEQQQNTPQLQVVPMENCDEETAKIRELVVKDIMLSNNAKTVYQVAAASAIIGGFGAFLIDTDYVSDKSFDLDIVYRAMKDPTRCYWDIGAESINKTDGMYCGYLTRMSRQKFRSIYGAAIEAKIANEEGVAQSEEEIALATDPRSISTVFSWADADAITIQDHYVRKNVKDTLYKLSNGRTINQEEMDEIIDNSRDMNEKMRDAQMFGMQETDAMSPPVLNPEMGMNPAEDMQSSMMQRPAELDEDIEDIEDMAGDRMLLWDGEEPVRIEGQREIKKYKIKHQKIAGDYLLEESTFPSQQLPLVYMDQHSYIEKDGKQVTRPFVIDAKDAQRYLNYLFTQSAYILKISRYEQFMASKKNVTSNDTQAMWKDPSVVQGTLYYDESPNGNKPEQLRPPELSMAMISQYERTMQDLYTSTGLYPTRLGNEGNEVSGKAIDKRTRQGSYTTYVVFNSINRAIGIGGEIVNEMIPEVYDTERVLNLMTPDEGRKNITINKSTDEYGAKIENDIRKGSYQVRLEPGPSYEGQKEEALASLQMVLQNHPEVFQLVADLYAENLPLTNTIELKNRLKTLVPPGIVEAGKSGKMPHENGQGQQDPQQAMMQQQAQLAQMDMQLKAKEMEIKEQELMMKAKQAEQEFKLKMMEIETERLQAATMVEDQKMRYLAETHRTETDQSIAHANNLVALLTHSPKEFSTAPKGQV